MGYGFNFECADCDYQVRLFIGAGFRYSVQLVYYGADQSGGHGWPGQTAGFDQPLLDTLVADETVSGLAKSLISAGAEPTGLHWMALYTCPDCWRLYNRFYFQLETQGGTFEPDYWCPHCSRLLEQADFDFNATDVKLVMMDNRELLDWHCPECNSTGLRQAAGRFIWN